MGAPPPQHLSAVPSAPRLNVKLADNRLLPALFGAGNAHLQLLAEALDITIRQRGNVVSFTGAETPCARGKDILLGLYARLQQGETLDRDDITASLNLNGKTQSTSERTNEVVIKIGKKTIRPRTAKQTAYWQALQSHPLVFGLGAAGTGKTFLAVAAAVQALLAGKCERIFLSRPAVEAGERLGFLPGDMREKIDPYLSPLYDALHEFLPPAQLAKRMEAGQIDIAPLAFMRGRTLSNAFVILDEAQNVTPVQMKMFLTRLGTHSQMVIAGDPSQIDLPTPMASGLQESLAIVADLPDIAVVRFDKNDVVRHDLVARIVEAYEKASKTRDKT